MLYEESTNHISWESVPLKYARIEFERQGRTENECCWNLIRSNYEQIHRIEIRGKRLLFTPKVFAVNLNLWTKTGFKSLLLFIIL